MQLLTIRAAGFTATVDARARDDGQTWSLSLLGNQQSVRALWARLVKGETAYLSEDELGGGSPCWPAGEARDVALLRRPSATVATFCFSPAARTRRPALRKHEGRACGTT